jgi:methylase of polypeptide subunit release factors
MSSTQAQSSAAGHRIAIQSADLSEVRHVGDVLRRHGYDGSAVPQALGNQLGRFHLRRDLPLYLRRLQATTPLNLLIKLFAFEQPVDRAELTAVLPDLKVDDLEALGLVRSSGDAIHPAVRISAYSGLLLVHDRLHATPHGLDAEHVLGVGAATVTLDAFTVRQPVRRALDLGTGCGVQALLAARHSAHVFAVDCNPRAVAFARFNVALNGADNVTIHQGNFFEPVMGEQFDLIVSNPPFVISPESTFIFRDGGVPGDRLCESLARAIPAHLSPGGFATLLCNWIVETRDQRDARPRQWVEPTPCDAWVLVCDVQDALSYSAGWNRDADEATYGQRIDRWQAYFAASGISAVGMGGLVLRRRGSGRGWIHSASVEGSPNESCSEQILRVFAAHDRLTSCDDRELAETTVQLAPEHACTQRLTWNDATCVVEGISLELKRGLKFSVPIDLGTLQFVGHLSTPGTLTRAMTSFADSVGEPVAGLRESLVSIARTLLSMGFLQVLQDNHLDNA